MRRLIFILLALLAGGCATPDSVKLQAAKIDALTRDMDDLKDRVDKLSETADKALKTAKETASKVESATGVLKK